MKKKWQVLIYSHDFYKLEKIFLLIILGYKKNNSLSRQQAHKKLGANIRLLPIEILRAQMHRRAKGDIKICTIRGQTSQSLRLRPFPISYSMLKRLHHITQEV